MESSGKWKATVFVGRLAPEVTKSVLYEAFIAFGEIKEVVVPEADPRSQQQASRSEFIDEFVAKSDTVSEDPVARDPSQRKGHRGFAYVEFENDDDAAEAIYNMNNSELYGRFIKCSQAKPPKSSEEGLGSSKALWEQEGWIADNEIKEDEPTFIDSTEKAQEDLQALQGQDIAGPRPI